MTSKSLAAAAALLISSLCLPVAQATPLQLAQAMQQQGGGGESSGGARPSAPGGGGSRSGGGDVNRGAQSQERGAQSQERGGGGMRERGEMRGGARGRVDIDRGARAGVYVRGDRRGWRHRRHGVRVWVGGPRCRTIIVRKYFRHRLVIKKIRRCR